jgi:uncharacterized protein (DUF58 family)
MLAPGSGPRPSSLEDLLPPELAARLDRLDVISRKIFAGKLPGERRSKKRGSSVEFDDYRDYVPGDDLRHIDWNVYARLNRVFVKLFREDEDLSLHVVLDASASMDAGTPSKLVFAQRLATALAYVGLANQSRVLVSIIGAPRRPILQTLAPMRGRRHLPRLVRFVLESSRAPEGQSVGVGVGAGAFNVALRQLALARRGRGVLVLISDFLVAEDFKVGLSYLAGGADASFDVHAMQVLAPGELEPEREPGGGIIGDLRLTDVETGVAAEVTVSGAVLRRYKERVRTHIDEVRRAALARDMSHALVRSDEDVSQLLLRTLRRRGILG